MSTTIFIFGATGDLAGRLLFPALARLERRGHLTGVRIIATGLERWSQPRFTDHVCAALRHDGDASGVERFAGLVTYLPTELDGASIRALVPYRGRVNVHYLALPPGLFSTAAEAIAASGLTGSGEHRLVVEKPFGTDGPSAAALEDELHRSWAEEQIFRIDHFLGKETVQNLSVMRFANRVIEPLLCATHVDHVQITVAERLGVEDRYRYYDGIGALRDMLQNHLLQLFCLASMDPPAVWDAEVLRDHKVEVLRSVRRPSGDIDGWAARGQYAAGAIDGNAVPAYLDERGIGAGSATETFAALRLHVDNWRWQGVPFYLRSGKRLTAAVSEIAYRFREPPTQLFRHTPLADAEPNWLVFRLDPPEGIDLTVQTKRPGLELVAEPSRLHTDYGRSTAETTSAYEQLLLDVIDGDRTPFLRVDEIDWAWRILDPVLQAWRSGDPDRYPAGSDGPSSQERILLPGHAWRRLRP